MSDVSDRIDAPTRGPRGGRGRARAGMGGAEASLDAAHGEERRTRAILDLLARLYPDARCALNFRTPFELLVATILSAQSTDKRVNQVTERLFQKYNTPAAMAALEPDELAEHIKELGLYRNKARHLVAAARILLERYGGEVPAEREALQQLPGVGRKTANVVLSNAFGIPAIAVDTHVFRVANRLGLASGRTPREVEEQLMARIPRELWSQSHHWLIHHGRQVCHARRPECHRCPLAPHCAYFAARSGDGAAAASGGAAATREAGSSPSRSS